MRDEVELICSDIALIFNGKLAAQGSMQTIFKDMEDVTVELEVEDELVELELVLDEDVEEELVEDDVELLDVLMLD